ncbi:hypothetical protein A9Q99_22500 [Gammaproteobacteria bacterium 45_16_T64]|nr:hypothetical protein A9Q99_22500 [Gammaproteobacteria bacterium 45_16_T64]
MSDDSSPTQPNSSSTGTDNPFSSQATGLVETTFAETLGLSMHNAVLNQQSAQMTASASITNACARLLQSPQPIASSKDSDDKKTEDTAPDDKGGTGGNNSDEINKPETPKKWLKIKNFMKKKPKTTVDETPETPIPTETESTAEPTSVEEGSDK